MRKILVLLFLLLTFSVVAQNDNTNKPSWTDKIPERTDAPDINVDYQPDTELDLDVDDLGIDRSALFDDESAEEVVDQNVAVPDVEQNNPDLEAEKQQAEREAEAQRLADQKAEEDRQKAIEKAAEEKRIADKIAADKLAAEKLAAEQLAQEQAASSAVESSGNAYNWKKIKNVLPVYPSKAARNKDKGWVSVRIQIDIYGDVVNAKVVDSYRKVNTFNNAALKAVRQWKFDPPVNYGIEENQTKDVRITFEL